MTPERKAWLVLLGITAAEAFPLVIYTMQGPQRFARILGFYGSNEGTPLGWALALVVAAVFVALSVLRRSPFMQQHFTAINASKLFAILMFAPVTGIFEELYFRRLLMNTVLHHGGSAVLPAPCVGNCLRTRPWSLGPYGPKPAHCNRRYFRNRSAGSRTRACLPRQRALRRPLHRLPCSYQCLHRAVAYPLGCIGAMAKSPGPPPGLRHSRDNSNCLVTQTRDSTAATPASPAQNRAHQRSRAQRKQRPALDLQPNPPRRRIRRICACANAPPGHPSCDHRPRDHPIRARPSCSRVSPPTMASFHTDHPGISA